MASPKKPTPQPAPPSEKNAVERIHPSVWGALKFSREDDAKRDADPIAYHLGLIYPYEKSRR